jgi:hypothetical protein
MITISEAVSRVRNLIKAVKQDAFVTDRFLYSLIMKHAKLLMRRQDNLNRIMKFNSVFQVLDFVELIEVDRAQADCHCITSDCYIKRTKEKLPAMIEGYYGPLIRSVTSIDFSEELTPTFPTTYEQMSRQKTFKYNKKKYYWFLNGYLYFPNLEWDAIRIEGVFEGDISQYNCTTSDNCVSVQNKTINVPEFLFSEIEQLVLRDLGVMLQIPQDTQQDNRHVAR